MFLVLTPHRIEGIPEWPRRYCRAVALVRFALEQPNYVGRFRPMAFPAWWRALVRLLNMMVL